MCVQAVSCQQMAGFSPLAWAMEKGEEARKFSVMVLNKHTDLVSSLGILAITTCLFASKIFSSVPPIFTRCSLFVLNYAGIIWLNVQIKDLLKSCSDVAYGIKHRQWIQVAETAVKVFYKGVNTLLTCVYFGCSVLALAGFPGAVVTAALALRTLSLAALAVNICADLRDYAVNEKTLKKIEEIEAGESVIGKTAKVMIHFLSRMRNVETSEEPSKESLLADKIILQLDWLTLETFREKLVGMKDSENRREESIKLFYAAQDSVRNRQAATKANLSLTVMGYLSMGLCKMFPGTLTEMATRWSMSVLYTDELIRQKLFQRDLESQLAP